MGDSQVLCCAGGASAHNSYFLADIYIDFVCGFGNNPTPFGSRLARPCATPLTIQCLLSCTYTQHKDGPHRPHQPFRERAREERALLRKMPRGRPESSDVDHKTGLQLLNTCSLNQFLPLEQAKMVSSNRIKRWRSVYIYTLSAPYNN